MGVVWDGSTVLGALVLIAGVLIEGSSSSAVIVLDRMHVDM